MKAISSYHTAAEALAGSKAELLAMIETLRASVEAQTFEPRYGWCGAGSLTEVGRMVGEADRFINGREG